MPHLELTTEQIIELVKQLPPEDKRSVMNALLLERFVTDAETEEWLANEIPQRRISVRQQVIDPETHEWLDAELSEELPSYEWGETGIPQGKPVKYVAGKGLTVEGGKGFVRQP
uniref:Uncharacterized protein n=1 Tax=Oscillatoriales cyanobacterium SpSt-402 TaxID=2282168 RepID=A0A832H296_9CYAN